MRDYIWPIPHRKSNVRGISLSSDDILNYTGESHHRLEAPLTANQNPGMVTDVRPDDRTLVGASPAVRGLEPVRLQPIFKIRIPDLWTVFMSSQMAK